MYYHKRSWFENDIKKLRKFEDKPAALAAIKLKRTEDAIYSAAKRYGVKLLRKVRR